MEDDTNDNNVVVKFGKIDGGKQEEKTPDPTAEFPSGTYVIHDLDGIEWVGTGFLIYTSEHVAVMKLTGPGRAVPELVVPLCRVKAAFLSDE